MIIAIDFDGTICRGSYPAIEGQQPYAREIINRLHADGHYLIIWTCRTRDHLTEAINWLLEQDIRFHRVNAGNPDNIAMYGDEGKKIFAHVYIDDKNLGGFPGWMEAERMIEEMQQCLINA